MGDWTARPVGSVLASQRSVLDLGLHVVPVHKGNEVQRDLFWTRLGALPVVGARAEELLHGLDHGLSAALPLGLTLRQEPEVPDLGGRE